MLKFLTQHCQLCGRLSQSCDLICKSCQVQVLPVANKCERCGSLKTYQKPTCQLCVVQPLRFGTVNWLSEYVEMIHLIRAIKFERKFGLCDYLAELLVSYALSLEVRSRWEAIVLSPIREQTFKKRGINHLFLIARRLADFLRIPILDPFKKRSRDGSVLRQFFFQQKNVLFIDDVLTTAETFRQSLLCTPQGVRRLDALFLSVSNPQILSDSVLRARLNWAWNRRS